MKSSVALCALLRLLGDHSTLMHLYHGLYTNSNKALYSLCILHHILEISHC